MQKTKNNENKLLDPTADAVNLSDLSESELRSMRQAVLAELSSETDADKLGRLTHRLGAINGKINPDAERSAALEKIRKEQECEWHTQNLVEIAKHELHRKGRVPSIDERPLSPEQLNEVIKERDKLRETLTYDEAREQATAILNARYPAPNRR